MYERASGWLTSRHTLVLTHTQAHTRSRVTLHTSFVHSKGNLCISACLRFTSTKHTHMHNLYFSQPLAFCLLLSYTLIGMQACAQKESKSLCSQLLFLSSTHTDLQPTHFLCDLLECHSIFVTAVAYPSDLTTSHQWALTDIADLFSDETDIKADLIVHQISSLWLRLISYFFIKKKNNPTFAVHLLWNTGRLRISRGCKWSKCSWGSLWKYSKSTGMSWDTADKTANKNSVFQGFSDDPLCVRSDARTHALIISLSDKLYPPPKMFAANVSNFKHQQ